MVVVNVTKKLYEDDKNRLYICYGGMPESSVDEAEENNDALKNKNSAENNLIIQYLPTDFTQINSFYQLEGENAELLLNDRREE